MSKVKLRKETMTPAKPGLPARGASRRELIKTVARIAGPIGLIVTLAACSTTATQREDTNLHSEPEPTGYTQETGVDQAAGGDTQTGPQTIGEMADALAQGYPIDLDNMTEADLNALRDKLQPGFVMTAGDEAEAAADQIRTLLRGMDNESRKGRVLVERDGVLTIADRETLAAGDMLPWNEEDNRALNTRATNFQGRDISHIPTFHVESALQLGYGPTGMRETNAEIVDLGNGNGIAVINGQDVPQQVIDRWAGGWNQMVPRIGHVNYVGISFNGFSRLSGTSVENLNWGLNTRLGDTGGWGGLDNMFRYLDSVAPSAPSRVVLVAVGGGEALRERVAQWNADNAWRWQ